MKELKAFEQWANDIGAVITEFKRPEKSHTEKVPVAGERDIARQSQTKYAGYDKEQALELFINDKLEDMEKRDLEQNKVINAQRRENDKLRRELSTLGQEVEDTVEISRQDHSEIERLRALAGQAKSDVETRQVDRGEIEELLKQVEALRNKPGVSDEQYLELKQQIEQSAKSGADSEKLQELTKQIETLSQQRDVGGEQLKRLSSMADELGAKQAELAGGREELANKVAELETSQQELLKKERDLLRRDKVRQGRFEEYKEKFLNFGNKVNSRLDYIEPEVRAATNIAQDVGDEVDKVNAELEKEKIVNKEQDQWIDYLYKLHKERANTPDRREPPQPARRNPYANIRDELENVSNQMKMGDEQPSVSADNRPPPTTKDMFESDINAIVENILGPQYSKYLK